MTRTQLRRRAPRLAFVASVAVALGILTGCASQIAALAPVGGDAVTAVRIAAIDVVTANHLLIKKTPVCVESDTGYACTGSLTDGSAITVAAPPDGATLSVSVGGQVLYDGSVQAVLDAAARGTWPPDPGPGPSARSG